MNLITNFFSFLSRTLAFTSNVVNIIHHVDRILTESLSINRNFRLSQIPFHKISLIFCVSMYTMHVSQLVVSNDALPLLLKMLWKVPHPRFAMPWTSCFSLHGKCQPQAWKMILFPCNKRHWRLVSNSLVFFLLAILSAVLIKLRYGFKDFIVYRMSVCAFVQCIILGYACSK